MSGLSRTPGKRVWDNIPTGVRIPPSPPNQWVSAIVNYGRQPEITKNNTLTVPVLFPF